jgi:hypothetical protein
VESLRLRRLRFPALPRLLRLALALLAPEAEPCVRCEPDADSVCSSPDAAARLPDDEAVWLLTAVEASLAVWLAALPRLPPLLARLLRRRRRLELLLCREPSFSVPADDSDERSDAVCDAV